MSRSRSPTGSVPTRTSCWRPILRCRRARSRTSRLATDSWRYKGVDQQDFAPSAHNNPLDNWGGRFGVPDFDRIKPHHFRGAFARAFAAHVGEVAAIAGNTAAPTFANTIAALETSGE